MLHIFGFPCYFAAMFITDHSFFIFSVKISLWWQETVLVLKFVCLGLSRFHSRNCLVGLVVKASASRAEDPGFDSHLRHGDFYWSSHTSDSQTGTPVATLPGAWHDIISTGTGWPSVSILWLGEVDSLMCSFYLSVATRKIVWADPSLRYTSMFLGR